MQELVDIRDRVNPTEILLVADAMTGQEAVSVAETFNERLGATGLILTKMDGDARGGAALSIRAVTGVPIKFIGTGEKLDALEPFHPDRLASRILGMGDVLSLIERAQETTTEEDAVELQDRMLKGQFNLEDFLEQLQKIKKMGPLTQLLEMIPGLGAQMRQAKAQISDDDYKRIEAIIHSMTPDERRNPEVIGRRRTRAHRQGERHHDAGGEAAAQAVRGDAEDDDPVGPDGEEGQDAPRVCPSISGRRSHQIGEEACERRLRVGGEPGVDRSWLDDGARWRGQPAEPLGGG